MEIRDSLKDAVMRLKDALDDIDAIRVEAWQDAERRVLEDVWDDITSELYDLSSDAEYIVDEIESNINEIEKLGDKYNDCL